MFFGVHRVIEEVLLEGACAAVVRGLAMSMSMSHVSGDVVEGLCYIKMLMYVILDS